MSESERGSAATDERSYTHQAPSSLVGGGVWQGGHGHDHRPGEPDARAASGATLDLTKGGPRPVRLDLPVSSNRVPTRSIRRPLHRGRPREPEDVAQRPRRSRRRAHRARGFSRMPSSSPAVPAPPVVIVGVAAVKLARMPQFGVVTPDQTRPRRELVEHREQGRCFRYRGFRNGMRFRCRGCVLCFGTGPSPSDTGVGNWSSSDKSRGARARSRRPGRQPRAAGAERSEAP